MSTAISKLKTASAKKVVKDFDHHSLTCTEKNENSNSKDKQFKPNLLGHASNKGKSNSKSEVTSFNIICQYKAKFHDTTYVFCENCQIYFCTKCDDLYHSQIQTFWLSGHVRRSVTCKEDTVAVKLHNTMMPSLDSIQLIDDRETVSEAHSLRSPSDYRSRLVDPHFEGPGRGFLLINEKEQIQVQSPVEFIRKLGCTDRDYIKVVSIVGNTGEGKSYSLNHAFFDGREVFKTSSTPNSCTLGVWAAYNSEMKVIVLDTEGLLGSSNNCNQRTRLLLKVMAISDVVIYRSRAERLHSDMYQFLGDASKAFNNHFKQELKAALDRCRLECSVSQLGPYVIIFHETLHTNILTFDKQKPPEDIIRKQFQQMNLSFDAFSGFKYVGTKTQTTTDFCGLIKVIKKQIKQSDVRSFRSPGVVFQVLHMLNNKFSGHIENTIAEAFPDQYFTCSERCRSCGTRCCNSTNHHFDDIPHDSGTKCKFQHQYQNRINLCKICYERGETVIVDQKVYSPDDSTWYGIAKYAWSGYIIECVNCGIIYQSRKYWYGNPTPSELLHTEIRHVWPGTTSSNNGSLNVGQKVLDGISYISTTLSSVSAAPSKKVTSWMADRIAPSYWKPNSEILKCHQCGHHFDSTDPKHHCRSCGQGFCEECSNYYRPVPERGWGDSPVRVCKECLTSSQFS
ncbi:Zinc finger FYVE domain-containing protein 1 [Chamberlinius hualienensis]